MVLICGSLLFWFGNIYLSFTKEIPANGGSYVEGIVGQPMYINPILSQTNQTDSSLTRLVYSGLMKYDGSGKLVNDLAERYEILEDGKEYIFYLKKGVQWHDGEFLTSDDVIFTINTINDPLFKSPLRQNWQGVRVERVDDYTLKFILEKPYFGFLENLTVGILPKHIWSNIGYEKFPLAKFNLEPIGTGPYKFSDIHKDADGNILNYELVVFDDYFDKVPFISKILFNFYANRQEEIDAYNHKKINGIGNLPAEKSNIDDYRKNTNIYEIDIPWSFTIFFNKTKNVALANKEIRSALRMATNKQEIIKKVLNGKGTVMDAPFFPGTDEYDNKIERPTFDIEKAKELLDDSGWKLNSDGVREKDGNNLQFAIITIDSADLIKVANLLKKQWEKIGAKIDVQAYSFADIKQNYIKTREYDALLVGQEASFNVDPYSFWHSSQKKDPGLNWALFDNKDADEIIEQARVDNDRNDRIKKYYKFQEIINEEVPAIFLFSPKYLYLVDGNIKGIATQRINSPQWRFANINNWYINTKRVKK